jgi:hypothetical protein
MTPVMHEFMHKAAREESKGALLGANEIDRNERQNARKDKPGENFADWDWNWPGIRRINDAAHFLPAVKGLKASAEPTTP